MESIRRSNRCREWECNSTAVVGPKNMLPILRELRLRKQATNALDFSCCKLPIVLRFEKKSYHPWFIIVCLSPTSCIHIHVFTPPSLDISIKAEASRLNLFHQIVAGLKHSNIYASPLLTLARTVAYSISSSSLACSSTAIPLSARLRPSLEEA